jgi:thiamine biosynthesis protein ThiC
MKRSNVPIGTVPVYEAIVRQPDVSKISSDDLIESVRIHIEDGVDLSRSIPDLLKNASLC